MVSYNKINRFETCNLQKTSKLNKCICVNYGKKDRSKLINKQYNKHEYKH